LKFLFQGPLKFIGIGLTFCAVLGVVLLIFIWYGSYSDKLEQEIAAYDAVIDYANNKVSIGFDLRDTDKIIAKASDSESCPSEGRFWVGFRSHPCWIVEFPTKEKTYRWSVDLRNGQKVRRMGFDHKERAWLEGEVYEYHVESLPPPYPSSQGRIK
jgi:hypothetical protein